MEKEKEDVKKAVKRKAPVKKEEIVESTVTKSLEFNLTEVIIIILITTALVSIASGIIVFRNYDKLSPLNSVFDNKTSNEIIDTYNQIMDSYIDKVDKGELIDAAIKGMYSLLQDEYSIYIDKDINNNLQEQLGGSYSGLGIEITINDKSEIIVNRVFTDSPAEKAGLKPGDILVKLNGVDLTDKDPEYVANNIKDSDKESFDITYKRDNKKTDVTIKRDFVTIDSVTSRTYGNVGYLEIDTFSASTLSQMQSALDKYEDNIKSLVIDVRDNTGGYLNIANDIADLFLDKGKVIYKLKDRNGKITSHYSKSSKYKSFDKIVVIINENSASASEILALALKENLDATIVGTKSFGKGSVQETKQLSSGAMVKYTTSYWLSPKGNSINKIGIKPDIEIKDKDEQLKRALTVAE